MRRTLIPLRILEQVLLVVLLRVPPRARLYDLCRNLQAWKSSQTSVAVDGGNEMRGQERCGGDEGCEKGDDGDDVEPDS